MTISLHPVWRYLQPFRVTILLATVSFVVFALPDQIGELYLVARDEVEALIYSIRQDGLNGVRTSPARVSQLVILYFAAWLLTATLALSSIALVRRSRLQLNLKPNDDPIPYGTYLLALAIALMPLVGLAFGFSSAIAKPGAAASSPPVSLTTDYAIYIAWASIGVLLSTWLLVAARHDSVSRWSRFSVKSAAMIASIAGAITVAFTVATAELAQYVGTLAILCFFLAGASYFASAATVVYMRTGVPVLSALIILALVLAQTGLNDNHRVEYRIELGSPPSLEQSFINWAGARRDKEFYDGRGLPYPIYLVSAEGGGLYAGFHAASFLAAMQDECPNFAQHVFSISSVSGGSLGAGLFSALVSRYAQNGEWQGCKEADDGRFTRGTRDFFSTDFLAPLVAATLFPDVLQRFLPFPVARLDRAKALERSFALAWRGKADSAGSTDNPFEKHLSALWEPTGPSPALIVNTTSVTTGSRISISPIGFGQTPSATHISWALTCDRAQDRKIELSLATAISLSARFPWLTPVGWLERSEEGRNQILGPVQGAPPSPWQGVKVAQLGTSDLEPSARDFPDLRIAQGENIAACSAGSAEYGKRLSLADGGYFENSGLETLIEISGRIQRVAETRRDLFPAGIALKTIVIFAKDAFAGRWWNQEGVLSDVSPSDLLAPAEVLLNTRRARARPVHTRRHIYDDAYFLPDSEYFQSTDIRRTTDIETRVENRQIYNVMLDGAAQSLPLGWHLSKAALVRLESTKSAETLRSMRLIRSDLMSHSAGSQTEK